MIDPREARTSGLSEKVVIVFGAAAGILTLLYAGNRAFFSVIVFIVLLWIGDRFIKTEAKPLGFAIYLQAADVLWLVLFLALYGAKGNMQTLAYVVLTGGALVWIVREPAVVPAVLITVLQAAFSLGTLRLLIGSGYGTEAHKDAVVHLVLRLLGVVSMYIGLRTVGTRGPAPQGSSSEKDQV